MAVNNSYLSDTDSSMIEAWILQIDDATDNFDIDFNIMPRTPSPSKRQRTDQLPLDPNATPRVSNAPSLSSNTSTTSSGRQSGSVSPKKRELELRQATDFPLERRAYKEMQNPPQIVKDLVALTRSASIPHQFKERMTAKANPLDPPLDSWFRPELSTESPDIQADEDYVFKRLSKITENSKHCQQRLAHESSWNDTVHAPLLELAFDDNNIEQDVYYQNITHCRVYPDFRDQSPFLQEAKVDYAIFLNPAKNSTLDVSLRKYRSASRTNRVVHFQTSDEANTPVAISIETKSHSSNSAIVGPAQLATWLRAHFRHLESLPNSSADALPMLPVVFVDGTKWRVDFAVRTSNELVIWQGLEIGSSEDLRGCYMIISCLQRLIMWCREEFSIWWESAVHDIRLSDPV
ncbi:hypothetical protein FOVG_18034 [Fusarium oxysporum f. sp. pisi HDV247]|uniref:PD-(D/E)XK nuclease-like domain-containing protein n=1 Tax=Fusarium oxysporum f. sp. pisi HDV247 TaxID=1080344 RepID=W9ND40_FUSOX|nr:hypothetical protein FOVG_18034 [Fusarium oxysporum f. sp. pisi HDV247]